MQNTNSAIQQVLSLAGRSVAMTGCTGGLGRELCFLLAKQGVSLIMLDRNRQKAEALEKEIKIRFPETAITKITVDLEDMTAVRSAAEQLQTLRPDFFFHNARAYHIPRHKVETGYDNVFQINFVSPYYLIRKLTEQNSDIKIIAVGSIAHNYSHLDPADVDFSKQTRSSRVYGNAKRFLMFSLAEYFKEVRRDRLAVVHPGITLTNITAHYPKPLFALIKQPMKIIFMKPKKAALCLFSGLLENTPYGNWIGPRFFGIWGKPRLQRLTHCSADESRQIAALAERIYQKMKNSPLVS